MVDLNRWFELVYDKPQKKGSYLLLVGIRKGKGSYTEMGVVKSYWNGKVWDIREDYIPMKWKYAKQGELEKYPDFNLNNRRRQLEDD